jgi:hypothetical protein
MNYFRPLYFFVLGVVLILSTETFPLLGLINGLGQLLLFAGVVCLPVWRTGRMCYVDIGWPWGLVLLGGVSYLYSDGYWLRSLTVTVLVILVGLRRQPKADILQTCSARPRDLISPSAYLITEFHDG